MKADSSPEVAVLGIDAAWTAHNPSGVALLEQVKGRWRCKALAASYQEFINIGLPGNRLMESKGRKELSDFVRAAQTLCAGKPIRAVGVDMPLSRKPIVARRPADNELSSRFNKAKCPTHSPNSDRPGRQSANLRNVFVKAGFSLATVGQVPKSPILLEVYPHAALLGLLGESERIKYKVARNKKYWPLDNPQQRKAKLLFQLGRIRDGLAKEIEGINLEIPRADEVESFSSLKSIEDQLDALVCAWVAIQFVENAAVGFGDEDAAIWIPKRTLEVINE